MEVSCFLDTYKKLGGSVQGDYLFGYLNDLNAETVIIEDNYIDKDYLIDYSNFYSRSFNDHGKYTTRLHFFCNKFTEDGFKEKFHSNKTFQKSLNDNYLGFVVIKPIKDKENNQFIGRTLLKTYDIDADTVKGETRYFIEYKHDVSLYGVNLTINSLPYQMQDRSVAACATTSMWVSLFALNRLFGVPKQSPFEITKASVSFPGIGRNFPSGGLNIWQIKEYFNSIGLETEVIDVENIDRKNPLIIQHIMKAYLHCKLPIIAIIRLIKDDPKKPDLHSVVISGYRSDAFGAITEIYLHDDGIGPYCRTNSVGDAKFSYWKNEWIGTKENQYKTMQVETLLIPIYPKMRHSFEEIDCMFLKAKKKHSGREYNTTLILEELNQYKQYLLDKSFQKKVEILTGRFPKYVWIIRVEKNKETILDFVFDATSVFLEKLYTIRYSS